MESIYLDNNATTRPAPEVIAAMAEANESLWANPSSVHRMGQLARQRVELARQAVAGLIGARPRELILTSGGTEANNLAIHGLIVPAPGSFPDSSPGIPPGSTLGGASGGGGGVLITTRIEHSAVREPAAWLAERGGAVVYVPVDERGLVEPEAVREEVVRYAEQFAVGRGMHTRRVLVSIQWANNETGAIQPIGAIAAAIAEARQVLAERKLGTQVLFHVDATQAVGKVAVDVGGGHDELGRGTEVPQPWGGGIDLLTLAAHKFHGPKGVGALWVRRGVRVTAQQRGGPQERDLRGGTENTAGIIGMGVAAELARDFLADTQRIAGLEALRDEFERQVIDALPDTVVNSAGAPRLWNTSNLGFPRLEAEAILLGLSERGVCASAGAACSSGSLEPSPVLLAMGVLEAVAHGSVRFSMSRDTTEAELNRAVAVVQEVVGRLSKTLPV